MGRLVVVAAIAAALAACGSSAVGHTSIVFGITGGNLLPYRVSIQPNGSVRTKGSDRTGRRQIPPARVQELRHEIQQAHLSSRTCVGALPDMASQYIRVGGGTVILRGSCEAVFERVWADLAKAVGLHT